MHLDEKIQKHKEREKALNENYKTVFGAAGNKAAPEVLQDLCDKFAHKNLNGGAFVADDDGGRKTAYNLGQASVIEYLIARLNSRD